MTARDFAVVVLVLALIGIVLCLVILALTAFTRWALNRESERTAAATFERDFIPEVADYADDDLPAMLAEIKALLDDMIVHLTRLGRAVE